MSTWGDKLQKVSAKALNSLAEKEFSANAVYDLCLERASLGFSWVDIRPSVAASVNDCPAVKALLDQLAHEKVRWEWVPLQEGGDPNLKFSALRIDWGRKI